MRKEGSGMIQINDRKKNKQKEKSDESTDMKEERQNWMSPSSKV